MLILSLVERDVAQMRAAILAAPRRVGALEIRLDALPRVDGPSLRALFEGAPLPLIATCRRRLDGGFFSGTEEQRCEILRAAIVAGARYVDLEFGTKAMEIAYRGVASSHAGFIVSHHEMKKMPSLPVGLYRKMACTPGAAAIKIIGLAREAGDLLRMKRFLAEMAGMNPPVIAFAMGACGRLSRIMALAWGSWAIYVCCDEGREAAPGQISLSRMLGVYRIEEIDNETRFAGIIGTPLGHSLSPVLHNAAFHASGLNYRYVPLEIPTPIGLRELKRLVRRLRIRGLSVTLPYKVEVMRYLDLVEPLARRIGAANTIVYDGRRLVGFNTDATGGYAALSRALADQGLAAKGLNVAIVGTGGTARALGYAVRSAGASVLVAGRSEERGRALVRALSGRFVKVSDLARRRYDVLVNCTPVGMATNGHPSPGELPVSPSAIKGKLVYDVVYAPMETALLKAARARGIPTLGGIEMLVEQAAEQYQLFSGRLAPIDMMREAVRQELHQNRRIG